MPKGSPQVSPSPADQILLALAAGWTLKSHRYLDGRKEYRLHPLGASEARLVAWQTVQELREQGLIDSNKKFPAATYLLTEKGRARLAELKGNEAEWPLTSRGWQEPDR